MQAKKNANNAAKYCRISVCIFANTSTWLKWFIYIYIFIVIALVESTCIIPNKKTFSHVN